MRFPDGRVRRIVADRLFLNLGTRATIPDVPRPCRGATAHPCRSARTRSAPLAPHRPRRRLRRGGVRAGVPALRQSCDDSGIRRRNCSAVKIRTWPRPFGRCSKKMVSRSCLAPTHRWWRASPAMPCACACRRLTAHERSRAPTSSSRRGGRRTPARSGLERAGIELDARGFIKVDERLQTTATGVWAMGECAGSPQFTHVALDDFRVVRDNLAGESAYHARSTDPLLRVHRSGTCAGRSRRDQGATAAVRRARGEDSDDVGAACASQRRDARLHEDADQC